MVLTLALILAFSPGEKEWPPGDLRFAEDRPANPVAQTFKQTAHVSPSPWGEGRDEGGRKTKNLPHRNEAKDGLTLIDFGHRLA